MEVAAIVILAVVIVGIFLKVLSGSSKASSRPAPRPAKKSSPARRNNSGTEVPRGRDFAAVSIQFPDDACQAVQELKGQRFLVGQVPTLPLAECDSDKCRCKYVHHAARRAANGERRIPHSLKTTLYTDSGKPERRKGKRRSSDPDS